MPYTQTGPNAQATFGTYNDVAGNQTTNKTTTTVGDVKTGNAGSGGTGVGVGVGKIAGGAGSGGSGGSSGSVNITAS